MPPDAAMVRLDHVRTWIFDLDNTLYSRAAGLFSQIDARMTGFIMRELGVTQGEADALRTRYWREHGMTLTGLVERHGVDPAAFLDECHRIDLSALTPDRALADAIAALPGRKIVHTNGARAHAERVLAARGLSHVIDAHYGIEDKALAPKPAPAAYAAVIAREGFAPSEAAMFEDDPRNLAEPRRLGMTTIWLDEDDAGGAVAQPHVDHRIADLTGFLARLLDQ